MKKSPADLLQDIIVAHPDKMGSWARILSTALSVTANIHSARGGFTMASPAEGRVSAMGLADSLAAAIHPKLSVKFSECRRISDENTLGSSFSCRLCSYSGSEEQFFFYSFVINVLENNQTKVEYCFVGHSAELIEHAKWALTPEKKD